jgi:hypothetical protein
MLITILLIGIKNANSAQAVVSTERVVFYRENSARMYSSLAYAVGQASGFLQPLFKFSYKYFSVYAFLSNLHICMQALIEIPYVLLQALIYGTIIYAMIGLKWSVANFLWYIFFVFFISLYFTYYGMMIVAMTRNQTIASFLTRPSYVLWSLFSGSVIPPPVSFYFL